MKMWVKGWKKRGWKMANGERVKDADLWQELDAAASGHRIRWSRVKTIRHDVNNELCDMMAKSMAESPTMVDRMYEAIYSCKQINKCLLIFCVIVCFFCTEESAVSAGLMDEATNRRLGTPQPQPFLNYAKEALCSVSYSQASASTAV